MLRKAMIMTGLALILAGGVQFSEALTVPAKAWLSQALIESAWTRTAQGEADVKPWPWMDSAPVARLSVPRLEKEFTVMRGTSGSVLAFAPGWHEGTAKPGSEGISLISGHRDTHFSFLRDIKAGDAIVIRTAAGKEVNYTVERLAIVQEPELKVETQDGARILLLSTCFPFSNWQAGGEMRFVIVARAAPESAETTS